MSADFTRLSVRETNRMLRDTFDTWGGASDLWMFGYASLLWRPEFNAAEQRPAAVHGWHRALAMRSRISRGTPECPGLVFALVSGGSCRGVAYRVERQHAEEQLKRLGLREMPTGVYDPKSRSCRTPQGRVNALAFTLSRISPANTGALADPQMLEILRCANGRFGSTLEYL